MDGPSGMRHALIMDMPTTAADEKGSDLVRVRRRQTRSLETRSKIVEAATSEFAEKGFEGASTREIADAADVRHARVLDHFATKRGLWEAVMRDVLEGIHSAFRARLAGLDGVEDVTKLKLLQGDFIRISAARPALHWLISHEAGALNDRIEWIVREYVGISFPMFEKLIRSSQAAGQYIQGDALHLHYLFLGAAARIFMLSAEVELVTGRSPFDEIFVEEHVDLCLRLFHRETAGRDRRPGTPRASGKA